MQETKQTQSPMAWVLGQTGGHMEDSRLSHAADCNTPRLVGARARLARLALRPMKTSLSALPFALLPVERQGKRILRGVLMLAVGYGLLFALPSAGRTELHRAHERWDPDPLCGDRRLCFADRPLRLQERELYETAAQVGTVFQSPRSQFYNVDTTGEPAFGASSAIARLMSSSHLREFLVSGCSGPRTRSQISTAFSMYFFASE